MYKIDEIEKVIAILNDEVFHFTKNEELDAFSLFGNGNIVGIKFFSSNIWNTEDDTRNFLEEDDSEHIICDVDSENYGVEEKEEE